MNQVCKIFCGCGGLDEQLNDFLKENKDYIVRCVSYANGTGVAMCDKLFVVFDVRVNYMLPEGELIEAL